MNNEPMINPNAMKATTVSTIEPANNPGLAMVSGNPMIKEIKV